MKENTMNPKQLLRWIVAILAFSFLGALAQPAFATADLIPDEPYCEIYEQWVPCPTTTTVAPTTTTTEAPTTITVAPATTTTEAVKAYTSPPPEVPAPALVPAVQAPELPHTGSSDVLGFILIAGAVLLLIGLGTVHRSRRG